MVGALLSLHGRSASPTSVSLGIAHVSSRQQLIDIVGVLRRPQTPAYRPQQLLSQVGRPRPALLGGPDLPLVRYVASTPWGERLYFVPMKPPTRAQIESIARQLHVTRAELAGGRRETLAVFSAGGGGGGGGGAGDAAAIEAGQGIVTQGTGDLTRITVVVPDGVLRVKFVFPRQPEPRLFGAPIYPHSLTVWATVHDNVAAAQIRRQGGGFPFPMIWYAADGHVVKRIGDLAAVDRVVPTPQPGPETALSRAAERDPSTPNRVWVTPSVGGPHTSFMVHFRILLNNASYSYRLTGTRCPGLTPSGGAGGGYRDLRGRIWSDAIDAVEGADLVPGTYGLSVAVMGSARRRVVTGPERPFGTATFTVRR